MAVNAAFRMKLSGMFATLDAIRPIRYVYGSLEWQCRGLIHFHGVVRFGDRRGPVRLPESLKRTPMAGRLDSAETVDLEFSASRFSEDTAEQSLITRLQQHDCDRGGCGGKLTKEGKMPAGLPGASLPQICIHPATRRRRPIGATVHARRRRSPDSCEAHIYFGAI